MSYSFTWNGKRGATAILGHPGKQEMYLKNLLFREYVFVHHAAWYKFAREQGYDVEPIDIVLVSGWVKTSEWALSAFEKTSGSHELSFSASAGQFSSATFKLTKTTDVEAPMFKRSGPPASSTSSVSHRPSADDVLPSDQCLFLRYYMVSDKHLGRHAVQELPRRHQAFQCLDDLCCASCGCFTLVQGVRWLRYRRKKAQPRSRNADSSPPSNPGSPSPNIVYPPPQLPKNEHTPSPSDGNSLPSNNQENGPGNVSSSAGMTMLDAHERAMLAGIDVIPTSAQKVSVYALYLTSQRFPSSLSL